MARTTLDVSAEEREAVQDARQPGAAGSAPAARQERPILRRVFKYANRYFMVPVFRLGLGPLLGSPAAGYIMVLQTTGRQSGKRRFAPLNYAILDGNVYCLAGWGPESHWFANLKADPRVEVILPGGALAGRAVEVADRAEADRARVHVARNAGFATLFSGLNPLTATDAQLLAGTRDAPVVRVEPAGLGSGPYDPGGWGWVLPTLAQVAALLWLIRRGVSGRAARSR